MEATVEQRESEGQELASQLREEENERLEFVQGLRDAADFYERTDFPIPQLTVRLSFITFDKERVAEAVKLMPRPVSKSFTDYYFTASHEFGPIVVEAWATRETVCEKRVIGTKEVPEKVLPARTEEVVEWICTDPLLKPEGAEANA